LKSERKRSGALIESVKNGGRGLNVVSHSKNLVGVTNVRWILWAQEKNDKPLSFPIPFQILNTLLTCKKKIKLTYSSR